MGKALFAAAVAGQPEALALAPFLQGGFPVLPVGIGEHGGGGGVPVGGEPADHGRQPASGTTPGEVDSAEQGFARFGEHGGAAGPIARGHWPKPHDGLKANGFPEGREPAITHQLAPQGGLLPHAQVPVVVAEEFGGGQAQHGIPQKFEPFVAADFAEGAVAEGFFDGGEGHGGGARPAAGGGIQAEALEKGLELGEALGRHRWRRSRPSSLTQHWVVQWLESQLVSWGDWVAGGIGGAGNEWTARKRVKAGRKPGSVPHRPPKRKAFGAVVVDHLSRAAVTGGLQRRATTEREKGQPLFRGPKPWPCSRPGFTEPAPLDAAGALLPHLCTLTRD